MPLFLAAHGAGVAEIGLVAAVYPGVWSVAQIATGHWSDNVGRKPLIVAGMLLQAAALALLALSDGDVAIAAVTAALLGLGTALVYPTLIAAISDAVSPVARAPVVGVYRFWRDMGYALGAVIAGAAADALGYGGAIGRRRRRSPRPPASGSCSTCPRERRPGAREVHVLEADPAAASHTSAPGNARAGLSPMRGRCTTSSARSTSAGLFNIASPRVAAPQLCPVERVR